jgi:hypothetical protein
MSFKINWQRFQEEPLHPARVGLAILVVFLVVGGLSYWTLPAKSLRSPWSSDSSLESYLKYISTWSPYLMAGGLRVSNGILAFSGKPPSEHWPFVHQTVLVGIEVCYILGPAILLWAFKARANWVAKKVTRPSPQLILPVIGICGFLVLFQLLIPTLGNLSSWRFWQKMKENDRKSRILEATSSSVASLALMARVLRASPEAPGGGHWSHSAGGITLEKMQSGLSSAKKGIWPDGVESPLHFIMEIESPDSMTVWGIADEEGEDTARIFVNKDGRSGRIQVHAGVTPKEGWVLDDHQ